tara:strand:+ start:412 stop:693 length:282 start_codon:yes stop_codon:yes gene_type:complete
MNMLLIPNITKYQLEDKIKLLLVMCGYDRGLLQFKNQGGDGKRYIRYGYWQDIGHKDVDYVNQHMAEYYTRLIASELYDEDCGWLHFFDIEEE